MTAPRSTSISPSRTREAWEEHVKPFLLNVDRRRIDFEGYRNEKQFCAEKQRFFCWGGVAPFEQMHPVCGHEYMLMGMALDPEWVMDMVTTYTDMTIDASGIAVRRRRQTGRALLL